MSQSPPLHAVAFYLPQFYPIPENDTWWGRGFTEWTNVTKARPIFPGHYQPTLPGDLGFYDLRSAETRQAQADLARAHGVTAFCYWHYWLGGRRMLDRPFREVLASGQPDFPFCLGWANHDWTGLWSGGSDGMLLKQPYPGTEDHRRHFEFLLHAFRDPRYVRVDGKPLFVVYRPWDIPDSKAVFDDWRTLATQAGLPGLHLVATLHHHDRARDVKAHGYDATTIWPLDRILELPRCFPRARIKHWIKRHRKTRALKKFADRLWPISDAIFAYADILPHLVCDEDFSTPHHPMAIPNWDTTPRYGTTDKSIVFHGASPELFRRHLRAAIARARRSPPGSQIVFLKSWNEWAEGNYLEPDARFGLAYLEALRSELAPA